MVLFSLPQCVKFTVILWAHDLFKTVQDNNSIMFGQKLISGLKHVSCTQCLKYSFVAKCRNLVSYPGMLSMGTESVTTMISLVYSFQLIFQIWYLTFELNVCTLLANLSELILVSNYL